MFAIMTNHLKKNWNIIKLGSGMAVADSGGNLTITSGTTGKEETILRSKIPFSAQLILEYSMMLSQRIANNNFFIELVDVLGDALSFTINSATSVTVYGYKFTQDDVGKSVNLGNISGAAGIPGRYAIASVDVDGNATFTVASWPSTGSGTLSMFGLNGYRVLYDGTTATTTKFDSYRDGWGSGDTSMTTLTSASPGYVGILRYVNGVASFYDQLAASFTTIPTTMRGSRVLKTPPETVELYLQIRAMNGTTNPASTTTFTLHSIYMRGDRDAASDSTPNRGLGPLDTIGVSIRSMVAGVLSGLRLAPNASDGHSTWHHLISAATTNATSVKASAGQVGHMMVSNNHATNLAYFKLYNKASAPTVGTDTPVATIVIPAARSVIIPFSAVGARFSTGIAYAITGGMAVSDTTAVAAAQVGISINYT